MAKNEEAVKNDMFGFGEENTAYAQYFIGKSYLNGLVPAKDDVTVGVANVNFKPGCRNNWHIHHDGYQIIMCTAGEGWYQIEGQPAQKMHPGDVAVFHDGVKHWHGATKDSWFSHVAIGAGSTEWLEPVDDEAYGKLAD